MSVHAAAGDCSVKPWRFPKHTKRMVSGIFAGCIGTAIGHPLDTVKARLQTQSQYRGMVHCFSTIVKNEGVRGLYRGLLPPLSQLAVMNMLNFTIFGAVKETLENVEAVKDHRALQTVVAGALTGFTGAAVGTPFEFLKVQMQLDNVQLQRFRGSTHLLQTVVARHGSGSLYTGARLALLRDVTFGAVYFGVYENLKYFLNQRLVSAFGESPSTWWQATDSIPVIVLAGGSAGTTAWFAAYPLDCTKTIVQGVPLPIQQPKEHPDAPKRTTAIPGRSVRHAMAKIFRERGGLLGFYKGVAPCLTRAFFVHAVRFNIFEAIMAGLKRVEVHMTEQRRLSS